MSFEKSYYFIVNSNNEHRIEQLIQLVPKYTKNFQIFAVDNIPELHLLFKRLKNKLLKEEDIIICVGGDGTLNQTVTQIRHNNIKNPVAFVPAGTGNDFARSNHIPLDFELAVQHIFKKAKITEQNILQIQGPKDTFFAVNSAGVGIDGQIIHRLEKRRARRDIKSRSYSNAIINSFLKLDPYQLIISLDDNEMTFNDTQLFSFGVNRYLGGGIPLFSPSSHDENKMDVVIGGDANFSNLIIILSKMFRQKQLPDYYKLTKEKVATLTFECDRLQCAQYDGEAFFVYPNEKWEVSLLKQKYWL